MRTAALYTTVGSLVLSALAVAPAAAGEGRGPAEARGTAIAAARAASAGIDFAACPEEEMLPDSLKCGTVKVPLDYAEPDGRQLELTVSRTPATGPAEDRQGAFVYNPGGPGASSITFPMAGELPEWKEIAEAYDLVGYAPRGVNGSSSPLSCQDPSAYTKGPTDAPVHPTQADKERRIARARAYARGCAEHAGDTLRHYTSLNNARDLDVLRAALGEPRLTFMGASYGTYFGALYATLFPTHVRRMVFDSVVDPDPKQIWYRSNMGQSVAFERRWEDFRRWVAKHDDVYHLGTTPEAVGKHYDAVRAELAVKPAGGKVGPGQLHGAFLSAGYYDDYWAMRATALSEYVRGNPEPLVAQASRARWRPRTTRTRRRCTRPSSATTRRGPRTSASGTATTRSWRASRPSRRGTTRSPICRARSGRRPGSARWRSGRGGRAAAGADPGGGAGRGDPVPGALELRRRLPGSSLVTERGAGTHGVGGAGNTCVDEHLRRYLLTGEVPGRGADCAARPEPNAVSLD